MTRLKRLAIAADQLVFVEPPVSSEEIKMRKVDYLKLTPMKFAKEYDSLLFKPVLLNFRGQQYPIDMNFCTDPYCKSFGLPQVKYEEVRNKPSRYKLGGHASSGNGSDKLVCNSDPYPSNISTTFKCSTIAVSNWSIGEEIARLVKNDSVLDIIPDYIFHKDECIECVTTPFNTPKGFYYRGESSGHSKKWQCKSCSKITNVLPNRRESFRFNQKRNEIINRFALALLNRTPVKRTCEELKIGAGTYYNKLEWLYRRCLEFNEKFEAKAFRAAQFDTLWLNTDRLVYHLNNVRRNGQGGFDYTDVEDKRFITNVVVTSDLKSRYVFRADVAYDWDISLDNLKEDSALYKDDHLHNFARKNSRLRFSFCPQPPSPFDTETVTDYAIALSDFQRRSKYVDGLHVNATYTSIAHFWLIKQMVHCNNWRIVTDEDHSIMTALFRVFARQVRLGDAHHFLCKIDHSKSLPSAYAEYSQSRKDLKMWGIENNYEKTPVSVLAFFKLVEELKTHPLHKLVDIEGKKYAKWAKSPVSHPLPSKDQGTRWVDCTTDISNWSPEELARDLLDVDNRSTDVFIQQIRRRLSILERPLMTARGEGKSYIYANFNPKYAQYAVTILRTYYNFCLAYKSGKDVATPAQRLGIAQKQYSLNDIIYLR